VEGARFRSRGMPGVVRFLAHGHIPLSEIPGEEAEADEDPTDETVSVLPGQDAVENSFKGLTVGPEILPGELDDRELIERLIALKDRAAELGWVKDPGIVTSLNKKLENALAAFNRGQRKAARNILGAFINELDALKGKEKQLSLNAYWLLKANAELLLQERLKSRWWWPFG